MSIGTAKPTDEEMSGIPHHFVDHISIEEHYTAGKFEEDALEQLGHIFEKNPVAIMVGGSGMYAHALINGIDDIPSDEKIRNDLNLRLQNEGIKPLREELKKLDPVFYEKIDLENPQRLVRAIEVCLVTGEPYSNLRVGQKKERSFQNIKFAINWERELLYDRINRRVDIMVENGLIEEARNLYPKRALNALQTVGYKELFAHFDGEHSLDEAIELIKRNTRRFAKRQMTWFKKMDNIHWIEPNADLQTIIGTISNQRHG